MASVDENGIWRLWNVLERLNSSDEMSEKVVGERAKETLTD